eukprot:SAG25_NODE_6765_length_531_cov_0.828704_1_plen_49_part_10
MMMMVAVAPLTDTAAATPRWHPLLTDCHYSSCHRCAASFYVLCLCGCGL